MIIAFFFIRGCGWSAKLLIDRYGEDAPIHAAMLADELLEKGDLDGRTVWLRVLRAIKSCSGWSRRAMPKCTEGLLADRLSRE